MKTRDSGAGCLKYKYISIISLQMSSGCLFTNGSHVLAGWQKGYLSGFGGKKESGESWIETAWRETLEELFELAPKPIQTLIPIILKRTKYSNIIRQDQYTAFVYSFKVLEEVLMIIKAHRVVSPLYRRFPTTVSELVFGRKQRPPTRVIRGAVPEISTLAILPLLPWISISGDFMNDLAVVSMT